MSLLKKLAASSMESAALSEEVIAEKAAAAEAAAEVAADTEIITLSQDIESDIEVINGIGETIDGHVEEVAKASVVSGAIEDVVNQTIETYGEDGITEQGAEILKASMESILNAAGINIPVSVIVPSFESGMTRADYSTEAEEKKEGIIKRILGWLASAYQAVIDAISSFIARFGNSVDSVEKYINLVKAKVDKLKGEVKPGEVKLGGDMMFVNAADVDSSLKITVTAFQKFTQTWNGTFGKLNEVKVSSDLQGTFSSAQGAVQGLRQAGATHINKLAIIPSHSITISNGSNSEFPLIGAKMKVEATKATTKKTNALTLPQMKSGLETATGALGVMRKIKESTDKWLTGAKTLQKWAASKARDQAMGAQFAQNVHQKLNFATNRDILKSIVSASSLMGQGWGTASPLYMRAVKAHVEWIDRSCKGGKGDAKQPELKTVTPDNNPQIGYDKDGKKQSSVGSGGKEPEYSGKTYEKKKK